MKYIKKITSLLLIFVFLLNACVVNKKTAYLQDPGKNITGYEERTFDYEDYRIMFGDELYIEVLTLDSETNSILNPPTSGSQNSYEGLYTYVVGQDGTIDYPFVGRISVEGKTIREVKYAVRKALVDFIPDCSVEVKLVNMSFSLLSESGSKRCPMVKEKLTIYQALAMSGDLGPYADRARVKIIRQTKEGTIVKSFDIRSKDIINSEFYYVRPNDVIYVHDFKGQFFQLAKFGNIFSTITTTVSLGVSIWALVKLIPKLNVNKK